MSEFQTVKATSVSVETAVAAKPRITADAFRNLTARLKKAEVDIPTLSPTAAVSPTAVHVTPSLEAIEAVTIQHEAIAQPTSNAGITPLETLPVEAAPVLTPEAFAVEPVLEQIIEPVAPLSVEPLVAIGTVDEPTIEAVTTLDPVLAVTPSLEAAVTLEPVLAVTPSVEATISPISPISAIEPVAAVDEEMVATTSVVETPIASDEFKPIFPLLPEFVPPSPVLAEPETVAVEIEPQAATPLFETITASSFQENFTYVPEPGKPDAPVAQVDLKDVGSDDEALKLELAQRAVELELENIWRLLLAKPTNDDRVTYLREAAEIHSADEEWNKPEPEHDLSKIAPAPIESGDKAALTIEATAVIQPVDKVVDLLPIAEGQDLAELTRSLLDMMAAGNASGLPQERALAADTLLRLVPRLELKPMIMLAQRLAMMDNPPNLLVSRLIRDPRVEVAGPLLEDCSNIADKDLEQIIQDGEPDKLRMIGRRRRLSKPIGDALIRSGDASVVLTLVRNSEAEISHDGFQSLLLLAEQHAELLAPLATRQDFSAPFAFELFWLAPPQLRRFIFSRFLTDSETLTKILKITKMANTEDESDVEPMNQHTLLEALERAARGHIDTAAEELSSVMHLSTATVTRILSDLQGDAIVVMLKAAAYPRSAMGGLLKRLQDADMPLISRERDLNELHSMFETLSFNKARILLTYWDWAQGKTGPYAPVH